MAKYRRKPFLVEATQWFKNGDHPLDYAGNEEHLENGELRVVSGEERRARGWEGSVVRYYRRPDRPGNSTCALCGKTMHEHGFIDFQGGRKVCPGDWIVVLPSGELQTYDPEAFAACFEAM